MSADHDPLESFFSPLRSCRFDGGDHRNRLEVVLMSELSRKSKFPSRRAWFGASILLFGGLAAAAGEWWEGFSVSEVDHGDGTVTVTVTDPHGNVAFDQKLEHGSGLLHAEDGSFIVVTPLEADDVEIAQALQELGEIDVEDLDTKGSGDGDR